MKNQIQLIDLLAKKLAENARQFLEISDLAKGSYFSGNYMNKNHGKTALKRQIVTLRQELKNLSDMIK